MVEYNFGKAASFAKNPAHSVTKQAVVTLNSIGILLADVMLRVCEVFSKRGDERVPVVGRDTIVCNTELFEFFTEPIGRFLAAVAYNIRDNFLAFALISVNQPLLIGL